MGSLAYRREMDLIGPHGSSSISGRTAEKDPMTRFELAKLLESVAAQAEADVPGDFDRFLSARGIHRHDAEELIGKLLDGRFREQR